MGENLDGEGLGTLGCKVTTNMVELVGIHLVDEGKEESAEEEVAAMGKRGREISSSSELTQKPLSKKVKVKGRRKRRNQWEVVLRPPQMMENDPRWDYVTAFKNTPVGCN